jgi:hypothetical protein
LRNDSSILCTAAGGCGGDKNMPLIVEPERDDSSIVLVGALNPAIFQPMWFAVYDLIGREEAENAEVGVVHNDITQFRASNLRIQVEPGRFMITCETAHRIRLKDLVAQCFGHLLPHTPIRMVGLNRELHYSCGSLEKRTAFGRRLAPREPWGEWGALIDQNATEHPDKQGGMTRLTMRNSPRQDDYDGYTQVDISGSGLLRDHSGIHVRVNDHFEVKAEPERQTAIAAVELIGEAWERSVRVGEEIFNSLMRESLK